MGQGNEIPNPKDSGVSGTQEKGGEYLGPIEAPLILSRQSLHDTFIGLTEKNPRNFGGDFNATVVASMISHCSQESADAKHFLKQKDQELRANTNELSAAKVEIAKLTEQLKSAVGISRATQGCTFLGTVILGFAVELYRSNFKISVLAGVVGAALIGLTFVLSKKGV
ncbi:hypothetical protein HKD51_01060 [Pseudomonas fragi]|nr:hypothetical protein [Pseudomonas sp. GC01]